jgi:hypothetical protein
MEDRVAILGVSLWATIPALAPSIARDKLALWLTRWPRGRGRRIGGLFRGRLRALNRGRGGPFGPPLFIFDIGYARISWRWKNT